MLILRNISLNDCFEVDLFTYDKYTYGLSYFLPMQYSNVQYALLSHTITATVNQFYSNIMFI